MLGFFTLKQLVMIICIFGIIKDIAVGAAGIVGAVTGPIIGLSVDVIAGTLNISVSMVQEALDAGCKSYEEIKNFHKL